MLQQFLAQPDRRYDIAVRDNGTGRSSDLSYRNRHGEHGFDGDLEMHLDYHDDNYGFERESHYRNADWRMRSEQHRVSEIRLGQRRDAERYNLYGPAIGELPAASAGDYVDGDVDGGKEQKRCRHRQSGFRYPRSNYAPDFDCAGGAKSCGHHQIYRGTVE